MRCQGRYSTERRQNLNVRLCGILVKFGGIDLLYWRQTAACYVCY